MGIARLAIAAAVLTAELYPSWRPSTLPSVAYVMYVGFSVLAIPWQRRDRGAADLFRLIIDLIVLLICAVQPPEPSGWLVALVNLFVLAHASILHGLREVAVVAVSVAALTLVTWPERAVSLGPAVLAPGALAILLGGLRSGIERRLAAAAKERAQFRKEAETARDLERQRIAADFHDGPLQSFISFQMRLEVIKKLLARDQAAAIEDISQLQEICRKQIADMRSFVRSMRMAGEGESPVVNPRQIAEDFQKTSGMALEWNVADALSGLEPEISHEVLQIIREGLHNAQKHSKASKVAVTAERNGGHLFLHIEDDGSGFPFGGSYTLEELELMRMGPESIKRRVRTLNGELTVESNPGRGSRLRVRIPL